MRVLLVQDNQDTTSQSFAPVGTSEFNDWESEFSNAYSNQETDYQEHSLDSRGNPVYYEDDSSTTYYEPL